MQIRAIPLPQPSRTRGCNSRQSLGSSSRSWRLDQRSLLPTEVAVDLASSSNRVGASIPIGYPVDPEGKPVDFPDCYR